MNYSDEMNEKIMNSSDEELRDIAEEMEFEVFEGLSIPARRKIEDFHKFATIPMNYQIERLGKAAKAETYKHCRKVLQELGEIPPDIDIKE